MRSISITDIRIIKQIIAECGRAKPIISAGEKNVVGPNRHHSCVEAV
jgi:hypothetical protein